MKICLNTAPYPHAVTEPVVDRDFCHRVLSRMRDADLWQLHRDNLYEALEYRGNLATVLGEPPSSGEGIVRAARRVAEGFGAPLSDQIGFGLHRQVAGQATDIHNDQPLPGHATHRVMFYFNEYGTDYDGGELNIYSDKRHDALFASYRPAAGSMIGFEASKRSYHSVEAIKRGERVVLVMYFYHIGNCPRRLEVLRNAVDAATAALSDRTQVEARVTGLVQAYAAGGADGQSRLGRSLTEAVALLRRFGADPHTAFRLLEASLARRKTDGPREPDPSPGPARPPALRQPPDPQLDSDETLLWWSIRLSARLHSPFTPQKWAQDLSMLQAARPAHRDLEELLSTLYSTTH